MCDFRNLRADTAVLAIHAKGVFIKLSRMKVLFTALQAILKYALGVHIICLIMITKCIYFEHKLWKVARSDITENMIFTNATAVKFFLISAVTPCVFVSTNLYFCTFYVSLLLYSKLESICFKNRNILTNFTFRRNLVYKIFVNKSLNTSSSHF